MLGHTGWATVFREKMFPPDFWDQPDEPPYFTKKTLPPLSAQTHRKCLLITHKKMNTPPASWDPPWLEADLWATKLMGREGFVNLVNMNNSSSSDRTCPSNGHSASSTSGLLAPAAQSSAGRAACSYRPWTTVMPRRPHHPLLLPPLARPSLYSPTPPVILRRRQPHIAANQ